MFYETSTPCGRIFHLQACHIFRNETRAQVHRAKIANHFAAARSLAREQAQALDTLSAGAWTRKPLCFVASSSLWGRVRGRFDLAYLAASYFSEAHDLSLAVEGQLGRWRKSALNQKTKQKLHFRAVSGAHPWPYDIIIFDDVLTTGATLLKIIRRTPFGARLLVSVYAMTTNPTESERKSF